MSSKLAFSISVSAGCVNCVADSRPVGDRYVYDGVVSLMSLKIRSDFIDPVRRHRLERHGHVVLPDRLAARAAEVDRELLWVVLDDVGNGETFFFFFFFCVCQFSCPSNSRLCGKKKGEEKRRR